MKSLIKLSTLLAAVALSSSSIVKSPSSSGDNFELLILHNNDMHARFEQTSQVSNVCTTADREAGKCYGGFPRVAHVVKKAREAAATGQGPPVLYLNAGDTYTGTAWFTIYKWNIAAEFINALQPDAVSLGNHEFDNGVSGLTPFIEQLTCPVLAANLILNNEPTLQAEHNLMKSIVLDVNRTKVGVIGYLTPATKDLAGKNNVEYIDEVIAIREEVAKLKKEGIKIFIALGHSGFDMDKQIAKDVADIDLVIGGHSNTFLWNGTTPDIEQINGNYPTLVKQDSGRLVPAVQAYAYTKYLGKLHLIFNSDGEIISFDGNPILLDNSIPQDADVLRIVYQYRDNVTAISDEIIGNSSVILKGDTCRWKECNMGNLITDAMIYKYATEYKGNGWTDAPLAFIQGGGVRASIAHINFPANITKGDLLTVMPFDGNMARITINGTFLLKMLEHAVKGYKVDAPQYLQMSGVKVEYDLKKPPGMRVINVLVRCGNCEIPKLLPLNKTAEYKILTPSFLSKGGDGYSILDGLPTLALNYDELECTTQYVRTHSPVYPAIEDRSVFINNEKLAKTSGASRCLVSLLLLAISLAI